MLQMYRRYIGPCHECSLVGSSISVSSCGPRLVDSVGFFFPEPFGSFSHSSPFSERFSMFHLMCGCGSLHPFHELLSQSSQRAVLLGPCLQVYESIINSVRSGLCLLWHGTQIWSIISYPFLQFLLHPYPFASCRQDKLWISYFVSGLVFWSLYCKSCLVKWGGCFRFYVAHWREC